MKKRLVAILVIAIIACMVFVTGCGKKDAPGPESMNNTPAAEPAEEEEEAEAEAEAEAETEAEAEAEESGTTVPSELIGETTETSYENKFFGLKFEAPETWHILDQEELNQLMGIASASIDDEAVLEMFESQGYVMDLYAMDLTNAETGVVNNVNITIQDIGKLYGIIYDEKTIAESSVETVKQSLAAQGATDINVEIGEADFLGKKCVAMTIQSKAGDVGMYQKQVYLKNGSAMACVTATCFNEDKTDEVLAAFKAL